MKDLIKDNKYFFILFFVWMVVGAVLLLTYHQGYFVLLFALDRSAELDRTALVVTEAGEILAYVAALVVLLFIRYRFAIILPFVGGSVFLLSFTLKRIFGEPRPKVFFWRQFDSGALETPDFYLNVGWNSFPSGHTMSAFALYGFLALAISNKKWGPVFFLLAFCVGLTRIVLTKHFLVDVYFGSILGILVALTFYIVQSKKPVSPDAWYDRSLFHKKN